MDTGFIYRNLDMFVKEETESETLKIDFEIGTLFENPLNRVFKKQRLVETVQYDFKMLKGSQPIHKRPDFKIIYANYKSPYYKLFNLYGCGGLEIKTHLNADKNENSYDKGDRYELFKKLTQSGFKWGVLLTMYKTGELREWSCVIR